MTSLFSIYISLRVNVWLHKPSLTPPLYIDEPVPSKESERSSMCIRRYVIFILRQCV